MFWPIGYNHVSCIAGVEMGGVGKRGMDGCMDVWMDGHTVGPLETVSPAAVASHPIINEISFTRALVSRVLALLERSCESLA